MARITVAQVAADVATLAQAVQDLTTVVMGQHATTATIAQATAPVSLTRKGKKGKGKGKVEFVTREGEVRMVSPKQAAAWNKFRSSKPTLTPEQRAARDAEKAAAYAKVQEARLARKPLNRHIAAVLRERGTYSEAAFKAAQADKTNLVHQAAFARLTKAEQRAIKNL